MADATVSTDTLRELVDSFAQRVDELKRIASLRVQDDVKNLWRSQLADVNARLHAMEQQLSAVEHRINEDEAALVQVEAVAAAAQEQAAYLEHIQQHLPQHLPTLRPAAPEPANVLQPRTTNVQAPTAAAPKAAASKAAAGRSLPRRYVTQAEMAGLSSYVRGRLTQEKVNAALDEVCRFAEAHARDMAAARSGARGRADRKLLNVHLHEIHLKEGVRGRWWFLESDCRGGQHVKLDKSGRAVLTALRALGRLQEVRLVVQGCRELVFVICT